ncbi:MAG TPA: DUF192 domain-containing protein [Acidimicrobiia bacterium]|nr:DUF192 domain-containing protein [Acidimicrobiia bacterium]
MARRSLLVLVVLVSLIVVSCSSAEPTGLDGFDTTTITISGRSMMVALADTPTKRSQGLMGVTDMGDLDGMLFAFETDNNGGFWMKDTLIPLDIVFFAADGGFVDRFTMEPCKEDPCPSYNPAAAYRYAVEAPAGDLGFVTGSSTLQLPD